MARRNKKYKRSPVVAALLAIFLGSLGIQFFYLGRMIAGVVCLIFSWTFIPAIVGVIHGIMLLLDADEFDEKYN